MIVVGEGFEAGNVFEGEEDSGAGHSGVGDVEHSESVAEEVSTIVVLQEDVLLVLFVASGVF